MSVGGGEGKVITLNRAWSSRFYGWDDHLSLLKGGEIVSYVDTWGRRFQAKETSRQEALGKVLGISIQHYRGYGVVSKWWKKNIKGCFGGKDKEVM